MQLIERMHWREGYVCGIYLDGKEYEVRCAVWAEVHKTERVAEAWQWYFLAKAALWAFRNEGKEIPETHDV